MKYKLNLNILQLCMDYNLNLHQLSKKINYDYPNLNKIANKERTVPMELYLKIIDVLKIDPNELMKYRI